MDIDKEIQLAAGYFQAGNLEQAEHILNKILAVQSNNISAISLLGIIYYRLKRYDSAIQCFEKLLNLCPNNAQAYYMLGHSMQEKDQLDGAIAYYQKALQLAPDLADAYYNLGTIFQDKKQLVEAIECYQKAIQRNPTDIDSFYNMGCSFHEKGDLEEAITCYQKALQLNPNLDDACSKIGLALQEKGQSDDAIDFFRKAHQLNPNNLIALYGLGTTLKEKERLDEAIYYYQKALRIFPNYDKAYQNLGSILKEKGQFDEAIDCYRKALLLNPNDPEIHIGLGSVFQEKGQLDEATDCYQKALLLNPNSEKAHFNLSLILLLSGNFKRGWEEFEWRWKAKDFCKHGCLHQPIDFSQPPWDGSSLEGKTLLIYSEQGVGDEIMFASCFQDVIDQGHACIIECDRRLIPIFSRSFPEAVFTERIKDVNTYSSRFPQIDKVISIGSLPKFFRNDFDSFPQRENYLISDAEKVQAWHNRLKTIGEGLKLGISWRGGGIPKVICNRSIMLEKWAKLFSIPAVHFINLQYGDCASELGELREKMGVIIHDWEGADPLKDLDNFAAQIAAIDLVISVDNSTVHMAGALGKAVWILLPNAPDWRWMLNRDDSPWYPTLRLFRQSAPGDWESVITKVADALMKFSKSQIQR